MAAILKALSPKVCSVVWRLERPVSEEHWVLRTAATFFCMYLLWGKHCKKKKKKHDVRWGGFSDTTVCTEYFWSTPLTQQPAIPLCTAALSLPSLGLPYYPQLQKLGWVGVGGKGGRGGGGVQNSKKTTGRGVKGKMKHRIIQMPILHFFYNISLCVVVDVFYSVSHREKSRLCWIKKRESNFHERTKWHWHFCTIIFLRQKTTQGHRARKTERDKTVTGIC